MEQDPFKEYIKETEPEKRDKGYAWHTAIGLQAVDGLRPSKYLIDTAIKNIEGDISIDEAGELLNSYYKENPKSDETDRTEEADKVSLRIAKILSEKAFSFTPNEYISIHRKLFTGIYSHAGRIRDYNITKKEWVLNGATVMYGSASELRATLEYDFSEEKKFSYKNLNMDQIIHHLAVFVSRLWQIHIFAEGNTRTTAVFFIKYLSTLGFDDANDIFAEHAWYFRNALVRANYTDLKWHSVASRNNCYCSFAAKTPVLPVHHLDRYPSSCNSCDRIRILTPCSETGHQVNGDNGYRFHGDRPNAAK